MKKQMNTIKNKQMTDRHDRTGTFRLMVLFAVIFVLLPFICNAGPSSDTPADANPQQVSMDTQDSSEQNPLAEMKETASLFTSILKVSGALVLVVGIMLLIKTVVKKLGLHGGGSGPGALINVIDTRMIAPKKYVAVLEVADEFVLVGITDQQINLLTRLENTESIQAPSASTPQKQTAMAFSSLFNKSIKNFSGRGKDSE